MAPPSSVNHACGCLSEFKSNMKEAPEVFRGFFVDGRCLF